MCLEVSKLRHFFKKEPKIAKHDIHVYKILRYVYNNEYVTPFVRTKCYSHKGVILMFSDLIFRDWKVSKGIHAFRKKSKARGILCYYLYDYGQIYDAIIPKGQKYYIGKDLDIVSDAMLIFTNEIAYKRYKQYNRNK